MSTFVASKQVRHLCILVAVDRGVNIGRREPCSQLAQEKYQHAQPARVRGSIETNSDIFKRHGRSVRS